MWAKGLEKAVLYAYTPLEIDYAAPYFPEIDPERIKGSTSNTQMDSSKSICREFDICPSALSAAHSLERRRCRMELDFDKARWSVDDAGLWLSLRVTFPTLARRFVSG